MKIGIFSDSHCCNEESMEKGWLRSLSFDKIRNALKNLADNKVDLVLCLGDLVDKSTDLNVSKEQMRQVLGELRNCGMPFLFVMGNHDFDVMYLDELKEFAGEITPPMTYDICGYRVICLDANYKGDMTHYDPTGYDWRDSNLPAEQVEFLRRSLAESDRECIVALHQPLDSCALDGFRIQNADEVCRVLEESGKVKLVLSGHMHEFSDVTQNGIRYVIVPGMSERKENCYTIIEQESMDKPWQVTNVCE